ncbi:MAG TPA: sugar MFS transporter [Stellaceae bacterium]|jgi:FHS family L-fucose permease-like MFS transporter|nr:sugar MFS transporter [Stellaceae bacterium]
MPEIQSSAPPNRALVALVVTLFFLWGFATVLVDTLVPKLKASFSLSYAEVMLTQFSFFIAYLVVSLPAGALIARIGYIHGAIVGLVLMAAGCVLFAPAASYGVFGGFLLALFVMAAGITILQVSANPLIAILGSRETSPSRLTLAQALNSAGTFIGPFVGATFILSADALPPSGAAPAVLEAYRHAEAQAVQTPFLGIAVVLIVLAVSFWLLRRAAASFPDKPQRLEAALSPLKKPRLALGALSIFLYVGAEVSIGSLLINYLMQSSTLGVDAATGGRLISLYWGGAMVGRFVGSAVMRRIAAGTVLAACACGAALLAGVSGVSVGTVAAVAVLAVGLCNSIMFPTIFALAIENLGDETPQGSGILCLAIVGGAVVPVITGFTADAFGLATSLFVPAICYLWIAAYGLLTRSTILDRGTVAEAA